MVSERWRKPTIDGELVTLRPIEPGDGDAMWEMANDADGNDLTATTERFDRERIDAWVASRQEQDERLDLAIVENATGQWAGEVVLNEYDPDTNRCSFRISLRGPRWFGRGLGGEATQLILDHAFGVLALDAVSLEVLARNPRARRVYERSGFVERARTVEDGEEWVQMVIERPGRT